MIVLVVDFVSLVNGSIFIHDAIQKCNDIQVNTKDTK